MTEPDEVLVTIRRSPPDDATAMKRCAEAAFRPYIARIGKPPAPMLADYDSLAGTEGVFVAELNGSVVGMVILTRETDGIWLNDLAVFPKHQGKRIGSALIQYAEDEARRQGFHSISLYTNEAMIENQSIYAHLGYEEVDRRTEDGYRRVYMQKRLDNT
jgi:GNAT superfamily N-acetyltransferase